MLRVSISATNLTAIHRDRFYHPQPYIMMRMHTLALHHAGESAARITILLARNPKTIRVCLKTYQAGGLQAVYKYEKHKHEEELDAHADPIEKELDKHPPQSANEASARIEKLTGIKRSLTQVRAFLKGLWWNCVHTKRGDSVLRRMADCPKGN
jgi:transposase